MPMSSRNQIFVAVSVEVEKNKNESAATLNGRDGNGERESLFELFSPVLNMAVLKSFFHLA